ncbi:MAG: glycosyltransferase family 2 protein [bacterium]|nr:glycosyltransferase family 2 protein [bacterium]
MNNISAIIVALGSPKYLAQTIGSINDLVDEIIIVDIGLAEETIERIKKNKKVIIKKEHTVPYVELIREQSKKLAKHNYVFFLDPDEIVPSNLAQIIREKYEQYDYISMPRKNIIFTKWIQHSRWWPDYQVRLFKKSAATWPLQLHGQPQLKGNGLTLEPKEEFALMHHNYERVGDYMAKMNRYAESEAQERARKHEAYSIQKALADGLSEFISRYFAADGYKDGMHGFALSFLQLMYYPLVYFYYWEAKKYEKVDHQKLVKEPLSFFKDGLYQTSHWLSRKGFVSEFSKIKHAIINSLS